MRFTVILSAVVIGISALVILHGGGSEAAWPGENGRIVYSDEVNGGIWIMDADGSSRQPLTTGIDSYPTWSPDGSNIVFERRPNLLGVPFSSSIWTVNPDGTGATEVGLGSGPSWSPDGTRIVYSLGGVIREINADGTGDLQITQSAGFFDTAPVYRPGGSVIAFLRSPDPVVLGGLGVAGVLDPADIWVMSPDGLDELQITNTPELRELRPDWAPDGGSLTYIDDNDIVVLTFPANVKTTILTADSSSSPRDPVFSPDGTMIAFSRLETLPLAGGDGVGAAILLTTGTITTIPAAGGPTTVVPGSVMDPAESFPDWEPILPPTPTPSPTATPGPTPIVRDLVWGDDQCDDEANPIDSLITLRWDAGLDVNLNGCPPMDQDIEVLSVTPVGLGEGDGDPQNWGNVDCDGQVSPVDSLKILRYDAGLDVAQEQGCPPIGDGVQIQYSP
ncbi:MAG: PD40 domain-containing protein [Chloroflexi bacterium]|nr:PD40 domain-containing protein [Chloroflexota bacterium]